MRDIAVYCGAKLYDKNEGDRLQNVKKEDLGTIGKLIVKDAETREDAVLLDGGGLKTVQMPVMVDKKNSKTGKPEREQQFVETTKIAEYIKVLKGQLVETKEPQFKMLMERRIASMSSAGGVIRVGSPTDAESLPLKLKIEDCVFACRAALRSGYVKGGGLCLKEIAETLPDNHILKTALLAPYKKIQENAGREIEIGKDIIDPTDAIYYAVEHATSVVASLITIGNLVTEEPEIQAGEGELAIAKQMQAFIFAWKREKGIMTENDKLMEQDMNGGMSVEEIMIVDNG